MTRRSRRASSAPQRVGSDEGLTSSRPSVAGEAEPAVDPVDEAGTAVGAAAATGGGAKARRDAGEGGRHTRKDSVEQTKDDTDEGWGEPGDGDASAQWLRENRPPHWG